MPDDDLSRRLLDELDVRRVMQDYARLVDDDDWPGVRALFADDAYVQGSRFEGPIEDYLPRLQELCQRRPTWFHFVGNQVTTFDTDGATVETYLVSRSFLDRAGAQPASKGGLRYTDRLRRTAEGGWEVVHRRVVSVWRWEAPPIGG